ncbi:hypothetical protein PCE1_000166 [Barthelona sp. PCE]
MAPKINQGAFYSIFVDGLSAANAFYPTLQICSNPKRAGEEYMRYRLLDGETVISAFISQALPQAQELLPCVTIKLLEYSAQIEDRLYLLVTDFEIVDAEPQQLFPESAYKQKPVGSKSEIVSNHTQKSMPLSPPMSQQFVPKQARARIGRKLEPPFPRTRHCPIKRLSSTMRTDNFAIIGRVTKMNEIREVNSRKGPLSILNFTICDHNSEIQFTAFSEQAHHAYNNLREGGVYWFTKFGVKMANKRFSALDHDYELSWTHRTEYSVSSDADLPSHHFNFTRLEHCADIPKDKFVDLCVYIYNINEPVSLISKKTQSEIFKRDLEVLDISGFRSSITLWGKYVDEPPAVETIQCFKGLRSSTFRGQVTFSLSQSGSFVSTPIEEVIALKEAIASGKLHPDQCQELRTEEEGGFTPGNNPGSFRNSVVKTIELNDFNDYEPERQVAFRRVKGVITSIDGYNDKYWYEMCPNEGCRKRVRLQDDGSYLCEKCQTTSANSDFAFMFSIVVMDDVGSLKVSVFDDCAKDMFKMSASEFKNAIQNGEDGAIRNLCGVEYIANMRINYDVNNNVTRYSLQKLYELNYDKEASFLYHSLKDR